MSNKLDFSDALNDLDAIEQEATALWDALHSRYGEKIDLRPFFNFDPVSHKQLGVKPGMQAELYSARQHNAKYDRLFKKMADEGMTYDEAVTSCDAEDAVVAGGEEVKRRQSIGATETELAYRHLRSALAKAARIHDQDETPVHQDWLNDVQSLFIYAGERPSLKHSFGCINHKLGFVPGNVRWQTRDDVLVAMGRRMVEYNGRQVTLTQLAKYTGVNVNTIRARYEAGKRGADLWNDRRLNGKYICNIGGKELTLSEVSRRFGIHISTLRTRLQQGAQGDALLSNPERGRPLEERTAKDVRVVQKRADKPIKVEE